MHRDRTAARHEDAGDGEREDSDTSRARADDLAARMLIGGQVKLQLGLILIL